MSLTKKIIMGTAILVAIALTIILPLVLAIDSPHMSSKIDYNVYAYQEKEFMQSSMSVRNGKHLGNLFAKDGKVSILHPNTESIIKAHRLSDTKGLF